MIKIEEQNSRYEFPFFLRISLTVLENIPGLPAKSFNLESSPQNCQFSFSQKLCLVHQ